MFDMQAHVYDSNIVVCEEYVKYVQTWKLSKQLHLKTLTEISHSFWGPVE